MSIEKYGKETDIFMKVLLWWILLGTLLFTGCKAGDDGQAQIVMSQPEQQTKQKAEHQAVAEVMEDAKAESEENKNFPDVPSEILEQLKVFAGNKDVWNMEDYGPLNMGYAVYDLDKNGTPELLVGVIAGTGLYSENHFYQCDTDLKEMVEISQKYYEDYSEYDITGNWDVEAFHDNENDVIYYLSTDYTRNGMAESFRSEGFFYLQDGCVTNSNMKNYQILFQDEEHFTETYMDASGNEITKNEWEMITEDFKKNKEKTACFISWKSITPDELHVASEEDVLKDLVESYMEAK